MIRTGIGFDIHAVASDRPLVLGGVEVAHAQGLTGHTDADVLCHAIMDALLGAVADGDIGAHFPSEERRWADADSLQLLRGVVERVRAAGGRIINVDSTVLAESPRLAPHVPAMRAKLAEAIGIPVGRVSVKATTCERLGAIGRSEGMAAMAVATVEQD